MFEWEECSEGSAKVDGGETAKGASGEAGSAGNATAEVVVLPARGGSAGSVRSDLHWTTCLPVRSSTFGNTTCRWHSWAVTV